MLVEESLCKKCEHSKVCRFSDDFLTLVDKALEATKGKNIIHSLDFRCSEFSPTVSIPRQFK